MIRNLSIVQNLELYRHIDDIQFARDLAERQLFVEAASEPSADAASGGAGNEDDPPEDDKPGFGQGGRFATVLRPGSDRLCRRA